MSDTTSRILQYFQDAADISPNDTVDLARPCNAIFVGTAGNIVLKTFAGTTMTFLAVPVGEFRVSAKRVYTTNTTAAGLKALYTTVA